MILIKCHLLIRMFLKSGTAEWYVVTKGRIFSTLSLFVEDPTSFHWIWIWTLFFLLDCSGSLSHAGVFWIGLYSQRKISLKSFLRRRRASPLVKPFLTPGGWQEKKWVYWKVPKSFAFEKNGIQKVYFFVWDFSSKFNWIGWWLFATTIISSTDVSPFCQHSTARVCHRCIFSTRVVEECRNYVPTVWLSMHVALC